MTWSPRSVSSPASPSPKSVACAQLDTDVAAWRTRDLSEQATPYVFLDATCSKARVNGRVVSRAVVIATGVIAVPGADGLRMAVIADASAATLTGFVRDNVAIGTIVHTDAWQGYQSLGKLGYDHQPRSQRAARAAGDDPDEILPRVHRVISNLKS